MFKLKNLVKILHRAEGPVLEPTVHVDMGQIGYGKGPIKSDHFHDCSAVVLDFGEDGAFFAHATPHNVRGDYVTLELSDDVRADDVVLLLIKEARKRRFDSGNSQAVVNAINEEFLDVIVGNFEREGIPIRYAEITPYARNITYNPNNGRLLVEKIPNSW